MPHIPGTGPALRWNVVKMFALAGRNGTPYDMHALLSRHFERVPELSTIQMWSVRSSIPGAWMACVVYALMKEGHRAFTLMVRA